MTKCIAVEGCEIVITNGEGQVDIQTPPQEHMLVCTKKPYAGPLVIQVSGATVPPITNPNGTGSASLQPGSLYCNINGKKAVLEMDEVQVPITGTAGTGPSEHPESAVATVKIIRAGQEYIKVT